MFDFPFLSIEILLILETVLLLHQGRIKDLVVTITRWMTLFYATLLRSRIRVLALAIAHWNVNTCDMGCLSP